MLNLLEISRALGLGLGLGFLAIALGLGVWLIVRVLSARKREKLNSAETTETDESENK